MLLKLVQNIALVAYLLFLSQMIEAQSNVTWTAKAQNEVYEQSTFEVNFTLTNTEGKNVKFPNFQGFNVLSGPSVSNSMTIINGARSSSISYSFALSASKIGSYTIEPASIEIKGKIYKTNALKINVVKGDIGSGEINEADVAALAKLKVNTKKAYVGQQIIGEYYIYYGENIGFSDEPIKPNYEGFFVKDLKVSQTAASSVKVGNRMYESILVDAVALYPQKAGIIKIGSTKYSIQKRISGIDPFSNPFGSYIQKNLQTNAETIDVKALPDQAPSTFSGGVGQYKLEASIDNKAYTTAQSIHLNMTITGTGDSRQVGPPMQDFGPNFEVFPARLVSESEEVIGKEIWHTKHYEYLITPKKEGQFSLKALFSYFDPEKENYQTITYDSPTFEVTKANTSKTPFFKKKNSEEQQLSGNNWLYLGILALLIALVALWQIFQSNKKPNQEISPAAIEEERRRNAGIVAQNQMTKAAQFMSAHDYASFYKEIGTAINGYLQNKYNISTEQMNKNYLSTYLSRLPNGSDLASDYTEILEKAELSMYGGYSDKNVQQIYERAKAFISACELNR